MELAACSTAEEFQLGVLHRRRNPLPSEMQDTVGARATSRTPDGIPHDRAVNCTETNKTALLQSAPVAQGKARLNVPELDSKGSGETNATP